MRSPWGTAVRASPEVFSVAAELLPGTGIPPECDGIPPGSGEGLVELLFDMVTENDPGGGKPRQVKKQTRYNACVYVDEGLILCVLNSRGSLLLPTMRSTFTALGQANVSAERKRIVPAQAGTPTAPWSAYRPSMRTCCISDAETIAGTPQRLVWFPTDTPIPGVDDRPAWPGTLALPEMTAFSPVEQGGLYIDVDPAVAREVMVNDQHRRDDGCDPLDMHRHLAWLKVAAPPAGWTAGGASASKTGHSLVW